MQKENNNKPKNTSEQKINMEILQVGERAVSEITRSRNDSVNWVVNQSSLVLCQWKHKGDVQGN